MLMVLYGELSWAKWENLVTDKHSGYEGTRSQTVFRTRSFQFLQPIFLSDNSYLSVSPNDILLCS